MGQRYIQHRKSGAQRHLGSKGYILLIVALALAAFAEDGKVGMLSVVFAIVFGGMMAIKQFSKEKNIEDVQRI